MSIYHFHHIIPIHMGGTDDPSNLVKLTVEEHAEAHRKLWEEHGHQEDYLAWKGLSGQLPSKEIVRLAMIAGSHKRAKKYTGIPLSEEHKRNISAAKLGKRRNATEEGRRRYAEFRRLNKKPRGPYGPSKNPNDKRLKANRNNP